MCYASPGPRCSSHARSELKRTRLAEASALALVEAVSNAKDQRLTDRLGPATGHRADHYSQLLDDYWRAKEATAAAREAYETTPEGIAGLKDELDARQQELDGAINNDATYQDLTHRLAIGQATRARQLADFKTAHGANPPTPDGGLEDEAEAAAAPPACTCIEYRYQSTCAHVANKVAHARRRLLPTSHEAALDAHAAAATYHKTQDEARTIANTPRARTAAVKGTGLIPEHREALAAVTRAWTRMQHTQAVFHATPAGQAFIEHKIATASRAPVYIADENNPAGFSPSTWRYVIVEAQKARVRNEAEFLSLLTTTSTSPETVDFGVETATDTTQVLERDTDTHAPPELLYANPCPQRCDDFQWVGDCHHLGQHPTSVTNPRPSTGTDIRTSGVGQPDTTASNAVTETITQTVETIAETVADALTGPTLAPTGTPATGAAKKSIMDRLFGR